MTATTATLSKPFLNHRCNSKDSPSKYGNELCQYTDAVLSKHCSCRKMWVTKIQKNNGHSEVRESVQSWL